MHLTPPPAKLVETKGYSTTMALSTFRKVEAAQILRRGAGGEVQIPASRVSQRVFGEGGPGRSKALSTGLHMSQLGDGYDPRADTCLAAFARLWCDMFFVLYKRSRRFLSRCTFLSKI